MQVKPIPIRQIAAQHVQNNISGKFSIRSIRQLLNGEDLIHELHRHNFFLVLAIYKGSGTHEIDFVRYNVRPGSVFILRPGQVHRLQLKKNTEGFLMEFDTGFYRPQNAFGELRLKRAVSKNYCPLKAAQFKVLYTFLVNIFKEYNSKQDSYGDAIKANLDLFFIEYIRQSIHPKKAEKPEANYKQERFDELLSLIETNMARMKNVNDYTKMLNLSAYQVNAITKASVGKTLSELIDEQIVLEAKRYLMATSMQVKDVSALLGYDDVSYFIRFFKKHSHQSPEAFRKSFQ